MAKADKPMSFFDHLSELRRRLIVIAVFIMLASIACFIYVEPIMEMLTQGVDLIYIRPPEAFLARIRAAFTAGILAASPVIFYQIVAFLAPALTKREKRILFSAVFMTFCLFIAGIAFAWFVVFPIAMNFFASFATEKLLPTYTISEYVSFATNFFLAFGLVFQLPLLFWVLGALGIASSRFLRSCRKYALVLILILSALVTPPDVISQILMAVPVLGLYELGILLVALTERGRKRKERELEVN